MRVRGVLLFIAALQTISWSARFNTETILAVEKDNTEEQTGDALQEQADRYHALLVSQERILAEYKADKEIAVNDLSFTQTDLAGKEDWYKFWNWEVWSDELPDLREIIGKLTEKVKSLEKSIKEAVAEIERLKTSQGRTLDAHALVADHKEAIQSLQLQISIKGQERQLTEDQHQEDVKIAESLAKKNLALFQGRVDDIAEKIAKHNAELQLLEEGNHDVQAERKKAQALLEESIASYAKEIKDLKGQIFMNQQAQKDKNNERDKADKRYAASIQQLENDRLDLIAQKKTLETQKTEVEQNLAKHIEEGDAQIASLQSNLESAREQLKKDIVESQANLQKEKIENESNLAMLKNKHSLEITRIQAEIRTLQESIDSSVAAAAVLQTETEDSVALSVELQKAVADLKLQKQVQGAAKKDAADDIQRKQNDRNAKFSELYSASSWYKFWYWSVWSSHKQRLEKQISFLQGQIDADNSRKDNHHAQMVSLQQQIEDAIQSMGSQDTLQQQKETLKTEILANIQEMKNQKSSQEGSKAKTAEDQADAVKREEEKNDAEVVQFKKMVTDLQDQKKKTVDALAAIKDKTHDQQGHLQQAQDSLRATIEGYTKSINDLTDHIKLAEVEIQREKNDKDSDLKRQDSIIADLKAREKKLGETKESVTGKKGETEASVASLADEEVNLKDTLETSRDSLESVKNEHIEDLNAQKIATAAEAQSQQMAHDKEINEIDAEVEQLTEAQNDVQAYINEIKTEHVEEE